MSEPDNHARTHGGGIDARTSWRVDESAAGVRLDAFVARVGAAPSAGAARRMLAEGLVLVDGKRVKKGERLASGQTVEVARAADMRVVPESGVALVVLYVDDALVAIDKPAGLPAHPLRAGETGTLANALVARFPECGAASLDPREGGLAHRLDVGTSGVMLAARGREAWLALRAALKEPSCEKVYLAEVVGRAPAATSVSASLGRAGRRSSHVRVEGGRGVLPAHTDIKLVEARATTSLVEARLSSGRAHQVRAHLSHLGCPVIGDDVYGDAEALRVAAALDVRGFRLHAARVTLDHPSSQQRLVIEAPAPAWARAC